MKNLRKSDRIGQKNLCNLRIENRRPKGDLSSGPTDQREVKPNLWDIDVLKTGNTLAISYISLIFAPSKQ